MNERINKYIRANVYMVEGGRLSSEVAIENIKNLFERDRDKIRGILEKACDYCDLIPMDCIKSCEILLDKLMTEDVFVGGECKKNDKG